MISSLPLAFSTIIIIFNAFDGRTIDKLLPARRLFPCQSLHTSCRAIVWLKAESLAEVWQSIAYGNSIWKLLLSSLSLSSSLQLSDWLILDPSWEEIVCPWISKTFFCPQVSEDGIVFTFLMSHTYMVKPLSCRLKPLHCRSHQEPIASRNPSVSWVCICWRWIQRRVLHPLVWHLHIK